MSYTKIKLDIVCSKFAKQDPVYRLYLDSVLVIERVFWPESPIYKIQEHLTMKNDELSHTLEIENVYPHLGKFSLDSIAFVDGDHEQRLDIFTTFEPGVEKFNFKLKKW